MTARRHFSRRSAALAWAAALVLAAAIPSGQTAERVVLGEEFTATW